MRIAILSLILAALTVAGIGHVRAEGPIAPPTVRKAIAEYLAEIDEIERVATQRKAEARARLTKSLQETATAASPSGPRYQGMLGSYFNQDGRIPFSLLSVPNGQNVFGDYARSVFNGKYDFTRPLNRFHARGHVNIPVDGTYCLEAGRGYGDFKLNGVGYSLGESAPNNRVAATVTLKRGEYEVEVSTNNNGGQLPETSVRIIDQRTEKDLTLYFYESELQEFQAELIQGIEPAETSKWTVTGNRLE